MEGEEVTNDIQSIITYIKLINRPRRLQLEALKGGRV